MANGQTTVSAWSWYTEKVCSERALVHELVITFSQLGDSIKSRSC